MLFIKQYYTFNNCYVSLSSLICLIIQVPVAAGWCAVYEAIFALTAMSTTVLVGVSPCRFNLLPTLCDVNLGQGLQVA